MDTYRTENTIAFHISFSDVIRTANHATKLLVALPSIVKSIGRVSVNCVGVWQYACVCVVYGYALVRFELYL